MESLFSKTAIVFLPCTFRMRATKAVVVFVEAHGDGRLCSTATRHWL